MPDSVFLMMTFALGTAKPLASLTFPEMTLLPLCAQTTVAMMKTSKAVYFAKLI